jgi:hypothetical protein
MCVAVGWLTYYSTRSDSVTEADWLTATDPQVMLDFLREGTRTSDRKLRLFAVACCRRVWGQFRNDQGRRAVEISERYADSLATKKELSKARSEVRSVGWNAAAARARLPSWDAPSFIAWCATCETIDTGAKRAAQSSLWQASTKPVNIGGFEGREVGDLNGEMARQVALLRDIVGNPFRATPEFDPGWLAGNGGSARRLAEGLYEERELPSGNLDSARLAVLADALEEAGMTDAGLLAHLRHQGPHVRGCWAVDLLLGKG